MQQSEILRLLDELSRDELAQLLGGALAKLLSAPLTAARDEDDQDDGKTLDANALAERLGISRRTLFRTVDRFPFIKRTSRRSLAARERDLNRWLARRA